MSKFEWTPEALHRSSLIFTGFALIIAFSISHSEPEYLQANAVLESIQKQQVECYHRLPKESAMLKCGQQGCLYPNGDYCTLKGCFHANGSEADLDQSDVDFVCRLADGKEKFLQDNLLHSAAPTQNVEIGNIEGDLRPITKERMEHEVIELNKNLERAKADTKRLEEKGIALSGTDEIFETITLLIAEAKTLINPEDSAPFWEVSKNARQIMEVELVKKLKYLEIGHHTHGLLQEAEKELGKMEEEAEKIKKRGEPFPAIIFNIRELFEKAKTEQEGGNFEGVYEILKNLNDLSEYFWKQSQNSHEIYYEEALMERGGRTLKEAENGLDQTKSIIQQLIHEGKNVTRLRAFLRKANTALKELSFALETQDIKETESGVEKLEFELKPAIESEIAYLTGTHPEGMWKDAYSYSDVINYFKLDDTESKILLKRVAKNMHPENIAGLLAHGLPVFIVEDLTQTGFEKEIEKTLSKAGSLNTGAEEIIKNKTAILKQITVLDQRIETLKAANIINEEGLNQLTDSRNRIIGYYFAENVGQEIEGALRSFLEKTQTLSEIEIDTQTDVEREIMRLSAEVDHSFRKAREEKFLKGIIPFTDTDDEEWFTPFAAMAKKKGLVKGTGVSNQKELNPAGITNVAETVTFLGRMNLNRHSSEDETQVEEVLPELVSEISKRLPEWAHEGALALEAGGVNLDMIFGGKNPEDNVSRLEVARLITQILKLPSEEAYSFDDLEGLSEEEVSAINAVNRAGIMTGEGGTRNFNPYGALNRAVLTKVLIQGLRLEND